MSNRVDFVFADLGENVWEVKRLTYDDYGFHVGDMEGVVRMNEDGVLTLEEYKNSDGIEMNLYGNQYAEDAITNGLIYGALRGFVVHGGGNGQSGIIEYHGYFYYYDGSSYDRQNGATNHNIYPLSTDVFTDKNSWTTAGNADFYWFCQKIIDNWLGFKGETLTGIETGFEEIDDIENYD